MVFGKFLSKKKNKEPNKNDQGEVELVFGNVDDFFKDVPEDDDLFSTENSVEENLERPKVEKKIGRKKIRIEKSEEEGIGEDDDFDKLFSNIADSPELKDELAKKNDENKNSFNDRFNALRKEFEKELAAKKTATLNQDSSKKLPVAEKDNIPNFDTIIENDDDEYGLMNNEVVVSDNDIVVKNDDDFDEDEFEDDDFDDDFDFDDDDGDLDLDLEDSEEEENVADNSSDDFDAIFNSDKNSLESQEKPEEELDIADDDLDLDNEEIEDLDFDDEDLDADENFEDEENPEIIEDKTVSEEEKFDDKLLDMSDENLKDVDDEEDLDGEDLDFGNEDLDGDENFEDEDVDLGDGGNEEENLNLKEENKNEDEDKNKNKSEDIDLNNNEEDLDFENKDEKNLIKDNENFDEEELKIENEEDVESDFEENSEIPNTSNVPEKLSEEKQKTKMINKLENLKLDNLNFDELESSDSDGDMCIKVDKVLNRKEINAVENQPEEENSDKINDSPDEEELILKPIQDDENELGDIKNLNLENIDKYLDTFYKTSNADEGKNKSVLETSKTPILDNEKNTFLKKKKKDVNVDELIEEISNRIDELEVGEELFSNLNLSKNIIDKLKRALKERLIDTVEEELPDIIEEENATE